jgi:outer membrane lipoprotein carrier protein
MKKIIFALLLTIFCCSTAMSEPSARQQLDNFLTGLHTLQADFRQTLLDEQTNGNQFASGTFYLSRPGRFRWDYDIPNKQYILADGRSIWLVEEDLDQVTQRSQKSALKGTPAQLLAGSGELDDEFKAMELGARLGMNWLELSPKDEDAQFARITLGFRENNLASMEMIDKFGQITRFSFTNTQRNLQLDQDLFRFIPPPGYDILDL